MKTDWVAPKDFPNLSAASTIAIDLETKDPNLKHYGPGWPRKDGHIVGFALATDGWCAYYPIRHANGGNLAEGPVLKYIQDVLSLPCTKVFHNAAYDMGWLLAEGFTINGPIMDTMVLGALIDENRFSYSLNALGFDLLKETKSEQALRDAAAQFGVDPKGELWKLPAMYVGEYAEQDAALTLKLYNYMKIEIASQDLGSIVDLESRLTPILVNMTLRGVRFDAESAERLKVTLAEREADALKQIKDLSGVKIDIWAAASIAKAFDKLGLAYPKTEKGAPSFTKSFLASLPHQIGQQIITAREMNKANGSFLASLMDFSSRTGRIHGHINQSKSDEGGTVTGRLSMANPNLQQVPARDEFIGPAIRSLFLPEEGDEWGVLDFSQQEPRIMIHYAQITRQLGAEGAIDAYTNDDSTDFHQMVADMAGIDRKQAKTIGLGLMYGMGRKKMAVELDMPEDDAAELIKTFHDKVPFLRGLSNAVQNKIQNPQSNGSLRTLLGRRCRFPLWEPTQWGVNKPLPYDQAVIAYGPSVKRAFAYKGLNRLIQGSAADQTKAAMLAVCEAGYGDRLLLQVHDELDASVTDRKMAEDIAEIMREAVKLEIPSKVDVELGPNWGSAE